MKKNMGACLSILPAAMLFLAPAAARGEDKVLAEIGAEKVTQAYLDEAKGEFSRVGMRMDDDGKFLQHLVERKIIIAAAKSELPGRAAEVERLVAEREEVSLAEFYRQVEVDEKVAPVGPGEVESRFESPGPTVSINRYAFRDRVDAEALMADESKDLAALDGRYGKAVYNNLTLPAKQIDEDFGAAILNGGMGTGDWFGPSQVGKYHRVYELTAYAGPDAAELKEARDELRSLIEGEHYRSRHNEVLESAKKRFNYSADDALIGEITSLTRPIRDFDDSRLLVEFTGDRILVGDFKDELRRSAAQSGHPVFTRKAVMLRLSRLVEKRLFAKMARADGFDKDPRFMVRRQLAEDLLWTGMLTSHVEAMAAGEVTEQDPALRGEAVRKKKTALLNALMEEARKANPVKYLSQ